MINQKDLALANLIIYYYDLQMIDELNNKKVEIARSVGVKSPNLTDVHGYGGTRDEQLLRYSSKVSDLDKDIAYYENDSMVRSLKLHLDNLEKDELKLLENIIRHKKTYEKVAEEMYYNDKSYVKRKRDSVLEKIGKHF